MSWRIASQGWVFEFDIRIFFALVTPSHSDLYNRHSIHIQFGLLAVQWSFPTM